MVSAAWGFVLLLPVAVQAKPWRREDSKCYDGKLSMNWSTCIWHTHQMAQVILAQIPGMSAEDHRISI